MSDRIEGIAILDETCSPARLHFVCVRENGDRKPWADSIPVRVRGTPEIQGTITWEFKIDGAELDMRPSVRMSYVVGHNPDKTPIWKEFFHNAGEWRILFLYWSRREEFISDGSGCDFEGIQARLKELNPSLLR